MLLLTFGPIVLLLFIFTNGQRMCENPSRFDWQEAENNDDFYVSSSISTSYSKWMEQFKALENNEFAITNEIPNQVCAAMTETISSNCREFDLLLPKWYLSMNCITACNGNMGIAKTDIRKIEVYCDFSRNNTLEQPTDSIEWGASCYCPNNSKHSQHTLNIPYATLADMLDEYIQLNCRDKNAIEETLFLFNYNGNVFIHCNDDPNVCDNNARCQRNSDQEWFMCICNDGYVGDGFECRRICSFETMNKIQPDIKFNDKFLTGSHEFVEGDVVQAKCLIIEQFKNYSCSCDGGFRPPLPICKKAIYIIGGIVEYNYDEFTIGVFYPDDVHSSKMIMAKTIRSYRFFPLAFNYENELYVISGNSNGVPEVECYDKDGYGWKEEKYRHLYENKKAFGMLIDSKYYRCGDDGCQFFDIPQKEWFPRSNMLTDRNGGCSFLIGNMWYLVGGLRRYSTNKVDVYNITSDSFERVEYYPEYVSYCAAASLNNLGYVCGGNDDGDYLNICYVYDPNANNWTSICSMNQKREAFVLVESGGFLYALLGYFDGYTIDDDGDTFPEVEKYDPITDQWEVLPGVADLLGKRSGFGIA